MFQVEGRAIVFSNKKRHEFKSLIAEVVDFDDAIVVRLGTEPVYPSNENVFAFDQGGALLWQIPYRPGLASQSPYVTITRSHSFVEAFNWNGSTMTLHPSKGYVIAEGHMSNYDNKSRRSASRRNWI